MSVSRRILVGLGVAAVAGGSALVGHGQQVPGAPPLPGAPQARVNNSVTPATEGWFRNADGTATIIVGYFNRNQNQLIDVPVGPNNKIEAAAGVTLDTKGPDFGQPTHFLPGRQYGMFSITVPKDFANKKLIWTLTSNGQTNTITMWANPPYVVSPFVSEFNGNTPPAIRFEPEGPELKGPPRGIAKTYAATVNQPLTLTVWVKDAGPTISQRGIGPDGITPFVPPPGFPTAEPADGRGAAPGGAAAAGAGGRGGGGRGGRGPGAAGADPAAAAGGAGAAGAGRGAAGGFGGRGGAAGCAGGGGRGAGNSVCVQWAVFRGTGAVAFANPAMNPAADGKAETTATFKEAGEYWLRAQFNDSSGNGGGGDQCCWSSALVKVNVK